MNQTSIHGQIRWMQREGYTYPGSVIVAFVGLGSPFPVVLVSAWRQLR